jgi:hypothetical protein
MNMSSEIEIKTTDLVLDSETSEAEKNEIAFKATQDLSCPRITRMNAN